MGPRRPDNIYFFFAVAVVDLPHVCVELALLFLHRSFDNNLEGIINHFFIYLLYSPNYGGMVTLFHKCMHLFLYIVSCTSVIFY